MSQNYKFKSLSIADKDEQSDGSNDPNALMVYEIGETKTVDFIKKDGTKQNFPYSHYMTAWYEKQEKDNNWFIKVFFATHMVTIHGSCLDTIYNQLKQYTLKTLQAHDLRYLDDVPEGSPFVSSIIIEWKGMEENN